MINRVLLATVAAVAASATPAMAQDVQNEGGFKVGALVGLDSVRASVDGESGSQEDVMYGITLGYDWVSGGTTVFGIEAEYSDSEVGVRESDVFVAGDEVGLSAGRDLYIGGRVGFMSGRTLFYGKAGYTNFKMNAFYDDGVDVFTGSDEVDGWRLGAGAEVEVSESLAIRGEYRYSDYGSYDALGTDISFSRHQGVITLLGKF